MTIDEIKKDLNSEDWYVRTSAYRACAGRSDIPAECLLNGLQDCECYVRAEAYIACVSNGVEIPLIRRIEPPELVYKKCRNDVIVVATIPKDAQVRGSFDGKCRASKATIVDVIGNETAVSTWDGKTTYHKGDEIEINDFDYSDAECSTGFHFFCNEELAVNY